MESGAPLLLGSKYDAATEQAKYDKLVAATNCSLSQNSTLQCLRNLPFSAINTDDEFRSRAAAYGSKTTVPFLEVLYPDIPGAGIPEIWTTPPAGRGSQTKGWAALSGDFTFVAPRRLTCQSWSKHNITAYCYRSNGRVANLPGSTHFTEVPYVFYNLDRLAFAGGAAAVPAAYSNAAKTMSNMWVSFFTTHDPNGHGQAGDTEWPRYEDGVGGYGENFVFEVERASTSEYDNWRAAGIGYLNAVFGSVYGK